MSEEMEHKISAAYEIAEQRLKADPLWLQIVAAAQFEAASNPHVYYARNTRTLYLEERVHASDFEQKK